MRGRAVVFEEAGYSPFGPHALNCAAPDEGNMHLLAEVATEAQRERYLRPLAAGDVRSCFLMTEPAPGAGSDPSMLMTAASKVDGGWVIDGEKTFITGAEGAAFGICMARTEGGEGATMFLVDTDASGFELRGHVRTIDDNFAGGHWRVGLEACFVPDEAVLGEPGLGFRYAQARLAPARLTHCMRFLGVARRALDVALDAAATREAFGARIQDLGLTQQHLADSVIDIEASRGLIWRCAWLLDTGQDARQASSVAKTFVAEAVHRVVDRSVQVCGGLGLSDELPLARALADARAFRVYDGPSEVHRWAIARRASRRRARDVAPRP